MTTPSFPTDTVIKRLNQALATGSERAIRSVFNHTANLLESSPEAMQWWARKLVRDHPRLAWEIAQTTPSEFAALWAWAERMEPSGWVAARLESRASAGHRLRKAAEFGFLEPVKKVLATTPKLPLRAVRLALTYALASRRASFVQLLVQREGAIHAPHVDQVVNSTDEIWALVRPHLSQEDWVRVGRRAAEAGLSKVPHERLEQAIAVLEGSPDWPEYLDRMLKGCEEYGTPEVWQRLLPCLRSDMVLPQGMAAALEKDHPVHVRQMLKHANADLEALRKRLVGGARARWDLVERLSAYVSEGVRKQWGRKYGKRFPALLAEAREEKALAVPPPQRHRARMRS